jgi:tetratricopeptide (TPR) repeat protein
MLEIVRDYARERLAASGREGEMRARHAEVFLAFAERWEPPVYGAAQRVALDKLEVDHDNLQSAIAFLLDADPDRALRIAAAIRQLWQIRGPLEEGRRLLEAALERSSERGLPFVKALNGAGILAAELGDQAAARRHFEASSAAAHEAGQPVREANALANIANLDAWERDYASAREILLRVEQIWDGLGDRRRLAIARSNRGVVAMAVGDLDESRRLLREGIELGREVGDPQQMATALRDLGRAEEIGGDVAAARAAFDESLRLMRELGLHHGVAECLEGIAALVTTDDAERAALLYGAADALRTSLGARRLPDQQDWYDRKRAAARDRLGPARFDDAFSRGRLLAIDEALALAAP